MKKDPTAIEQQGPGAPRAPGAGQETQRTAAGQSASTSTSLAGQGNSGEASAGKGGDGGSGPSGGAGKASSLLPAIASPKGGGAIRGIGEKFSVNAATGTASLTVPIATSPGRSGFGPELSLSYDSGSGNGPFGLGFHLSVPAVTRKTDKGLPRYWDEEESDVYVMSGAEDLVPERDASGTGQAHVVRGDFTAYRYRPRVEGAFVRIERWVHNSTRAVHWRVTTKENVTHIYGQSEVVTLPDPEDRDVPEPRIFDPAEPTRVFSWLIEESHDDKGNVIRYEYKAEDGVNVPSSLSEKSRVERAGAVPEFRATAQRYLKRILYGNRTQRVITDPADEFELYSLDPRDYLFEVVFDYGEHDVTAPSHTENAAWSVRQDPFSSYRSGFEVRSYRLCRRVMMFHRFGPTGSAPPVLVKSTDFHYEPGPVVTYLRTVRHWGYVVNAAGNILESARLPELAFDYQRAGWNDVITALPRESLEGLTGGIDGGRKQWVDLDGEGIPGVLIDADGAWYYKSNLGAGQLTAPKRLTTMPSPGGLAGGVQKLEDLGGDGQLDLVQYGAPLQGYFTRTTEGGFEAQRYFQSLPNIDWNDPNLRFIDLDGDGHGDLLITEDHAFIWYRSKAKGGFEEASRWCPSRDEDKGPAVVFADGTQSVQLADMSGDGLVDIVRVRNGEVCYWPNLGYGRFGAKITLERSPVFAASDQFDARRVRFGDLDGSGTSDIFYLGTQEVAVYLNESGNRLSVKRPLLSLPPVDNVAQISIVDLLGQGTSCVVWSSSLPGAANCPVFYVDLMGGLKPHLLNVVTNNLGAQTRITYSTSTQHYLRDKAEGNRWLTRLSFPVQVVDRIVHEDFISKGVLSTRYRYHHGFFDGEEREFRGFAAVEQWDAEEYVVGATDPVLYQAPVHTKTWFHTGAWLEKERLEGALQVEYFPPGPKDGTAAEDLYLPDTVYEPDTIPLPMTTTDEREAARALRGHVLRTEVYADDNDPVLSRRPYVVTEQNFAVRRIQSSAHAPRGAKYGVFFVFPRETLTIHTERLVGDPRVGHELVLHVDDFGNVTRKASVVYGRVGTGWPQEQSRAYATLTETAFTNVADQADWYRAGVQYEQATWELTGLTLDSGKRLWNVEDLVLEIAGLPERGYHQPASATTAGRRLVERNRQLFYDEALSDTALDLGAITARLLPFQTYQLALTPELVGQIVATSAGFVGPANQLNPGILTSLSGGAYVHAVFAPSVDPPVEDPNYWAPSGRVFFAASEFYLPERARDPFNNEYRVDYDEYSLLMVTTRDPLGNAVQAENDYRVLAPHRVTDPNLNRSEVGFDALGMVTRTAVMGKATGPAEGDTLVDPTTRLEYNLLSWEPPPPGGVRRPTSVHTFARERHGAANLRWQESFTYSDGFGRVLMQKVQAEAGPVPGVTGDVADRWVGTGRTVFNNKGKPVKQYEPFFSATSAYEDEAAIVETGVTPIIHYDPLDRVILTELPNGTLSRVVFDAWRQESWDPNDTVLESTWYSSRGSPPSSGPMPTTNAEARAAWLAAQHANTPSITHLDSLGRAFLVEADMGPNTPALSTHLHYSTKTELDIEGNQLAIVDALGIRTIEQQFDVLGRRIAVTSPDAGRRLTVADVTGAPLRSWDSRGQTMRSSFDALRRPTHVFVRQSGATTEQVVTRTIYGESLDGLAPLPPPATPPAAPTAAQALNLRGQTYLVFDGAGLAKSERFDFKGNLLSSTRHLASNYVELPTWEALHELGPSVTPGDIEADAITDGLEASTGAVPTRFSTSSEYDALNRVTRSVAPDLSETAPVYNRANFLERMLVTAGGATRAAVHSMSYNEKGQRLVCEYSEQTVDGDDPAYTTTYSYDPETFRLRTLVTARASDGVQLQNLAYTYDPVGNIVEIRDTGAPVPIYATALAAEAHGTYEYDPLYRLTQAEGREHPGQQVSHVDEEPGALPDVSDTSGLIRYRETYQYDSVGNILRMHHQPLASGYSAWERRYLYAYADALIHPAVVPSNRLLATSIPEDDDGDYSAEYSYTELPTNNAGLHGSMISMPHLPAIHWDYADRMQRADTTVGAGPGTVYFTYDASGQRVRKVWNHSSLREERIYLGGYEVYRRWNVGSSTTPDVLRVHRTTLHVMDDQRRVAMVENTIIDPAVTTGTRWRFQLDNHLGTATVEVDAAGNVISYEEYHPYGTSALRVQRVSPGFSQKRYRYTGKERDEETGLYYHGARYYAPWLGRWTAADPLGVAQPGKPDVNLYTYVSGRPVVAFDATGTDSSGTGFNIWTYIFGAKAQPRTPADLVAERRRSVQREATANKPPTDKPGPSQGKSEPGSDTATPAQQSGTAQRQSAFEQWWSLVKRWEGGYVNDPHDRGGPTKQGLTLDTARRLLQKPNMTKEDLAALRPETISGAAERLYKSWRVEELASPALRGMLADLFWGGYKDSAMNRALQSAGGRPVARLIQPAGAMSNEMITEINSLDPEKLLDAVYHEFRAERESNARGPNQGKYLTGWLQRLGSFYVQAKLAMGGSAARDAVTWFNQQSPSDRAGISARLSREQAGALRQNAQAGTR